MLYYNLDLDVVNLYKKSLDGYPVDCELETDYTVSQISGFAYCRAERIAVDRLHRLDEFKALIDQFLDSKYFENYVQLREEIVGSYSVEMNNEVSAKISKEEMIKQNKSVATAMSTFLNK